MRNFLLFLLLCLSFLITAFISEGLLNTNELLSNSLINQLSPTQAEHVLTTQERWWWLGYALMPMILFCKLCVVAIILQTGLLLISVKGDFSIIFSTVIHAEFIFIIAAIIKTLWLYFFWPGFTLEELQFFSPFSLLSFIGYENVPTWSIYPLQLINIFELAYWLLLAYGLQLLMKTSFKKSLAVVAASYGTGLILWVAFITFITVSIGA